MQISLRTLLQGGTLPVWPALLAGLPPPSSGPCLSNASLIEQKAPQSPEDQERARNWRLFHGLFLMMTRRKYVFCFEGPQAPQWCDKERFKYLEFPRLSDLPKDPKVYLEGKWKRTIMRRSAARQKQTVQVARANSLEHLSLISKTWPKTLDFLVLCRAWEAVSPPKENIECFLEEALLIDITQAAFFPQQKLLAPDEVTRELKRLELLPGHVLDVSLKTDRARRYNQIEPGDFWQTTYRLPLEDVVEITHTTD
jgi:hypothetical protein